MEPSISNNSGFIPALFLRAVGSPKETNFFDDNKVNSFQFDADLQFLRLTISGQNTALRFGLMAGIGIGGFWNDSREGNEALVRGIFHFDYKIRGHHFSPYAQLSIEAVGAFRTDTGDLWERVGYGQISPETGVKIALGDPDDALNVLMIGNRLGVPFGVTNIPTTWQGVLGFAHAF